MTTALQARPAQAPRRLAQVSGLVALGLALAACAPATVQTEATGWLAAASPKRLEVNQAKYRHSIYFATDSAEIDTDEQDRLLAFLQAANVGDSDTVRLEGHADERADDLYNLELASRRAQAVADLLRHHGLAAPQIQPLSYGERLPATADRTPAAWQRNRRVELLLERYVVTTPACPDWSRASGVDFSNQPHSNLGCASQTNLGLMVAEPRDLVSGRKLAPADGVHQAQGVTRYREGKVTDLQKERVQ